MLITKKVVRHVTVRETFMTEIRLRQKKIRYRFLNTYLKLPQTCFKLYRKYTDKLNTEALWLCLMGAQS